MLLPAKHASSVVPSLKAISMEQRCFCARPLDVTGKEAMMAAKGFCCLVSVLIVLALGACKPIAPPTAQVATPQATNMQTPSPASTAIPGPTPTSVVENEEDSMALSADQLVAAAQAARLGVPVEDVKLLEARQVTWPDASLG